MSEAVQKQFAQANAYELKPHVSLLYANLPAPERQRLAEGLTVPVALHFDSLCAVVTGHQTQSKHDVEAWRVLAEHPLANSRV